jgi:transcriptional regulator with XRE-family HTH domain
MRVKKPLVMNQPQVGKLIRELRLLTGLTQEQFAAQLGVTHSSISRWERGCSKPSPLALQKVEGMLQQMGDRTQDLLVKYFSEQG